MERVDKTEAEWREQLTPEQFQILRRRQTEAPFSGQYVHVSAEGTYSCAGCDTALFRSGAKFESGTGWPSFFEAVEPGRVRTRRDWSMLIPRTEILCATCDGHLGHVFGDGPRPTGKRFCVNSASLCFHRDDPVERPGT